MNPLRHVYSLVHSVAFATLVLLLSACSILPKTEPVDVYQLPATTFSPAHGIKPLALSLRVSRPASGLLLSGRNIVVMPKDNQLNVYKGVRWSDAAPDLVQNRLLDAFRDDGRIASLSSGEKNIHADYELQSDLRTFQSEYHDGAPVVMIRLEALLVLPTSARIVASRRFEVKQAATGTKVTEVVQAFGLASDKLAKQLVDWAVEQAAAPR